MNDWTQLLLSTVVAPGLAALMAYFVTIRKERADIRKVGADTSNTDASTARIYQEIAENEAKRREICAKECDEYKKLAEQEQDARRELSDQNNMLLSENLILKKLLTANGINFDRLLPPKGTS